MINRFTVSYIVIFYNNQEFTVINSFLEFTYSQASPHFPDMKSYKTDR